MPQLDRFLSAMPQYQAERLVLESDNPVSFHIGGETRQLNQQSLQAEQITALIAELADSSVIEGFRRDGKAQFDYVLDGQRFRGVLEESAGKVVAQLWDASRSKEDGPVEVGPVGGIDLKAYGVDPEAEVIPPNIDPRYRAEMDGLLREMVEKGASDLHLTCGTHPTLRIDGSISEMKDHAPIDPAHMIQLLLSITPQRNRDQFLKKRDTDFAYAIEDLSRFRVNLFYDRLGPGAVLRAIPNEILSAEQLGLPPLVHELARLSKGLVLVTGPTGSGKSTTLAAILDIVNSTRTEHIITIEDPVEFVHPHKKCLVNQREVGVHTGSFKSALRAALREDPDVILVGEMRDLETVEIAIETAETGHLVFGTLHTTTAPSTVDRLINQFPAERQEQIRIMLADSLRAVISQTLCKKIGGGRIAAQEILLGLPSVSNLIREGKTFQIENAMQTGRKQGMRTLNDHLLELVKNKQVAPMEAYLKAVDKHGLKEALQRQGIAIEF